MNGINLEYSKARSLALILTTVLGIVCCGCSQNSNSGILGFGNSVLSAVGYSPHQESFAGQEGMVNSIDTPTPEQEYFLGRAVSAAIIKRYPLYNDAALTNYLDKVLQTVAASSDLPDTYGGYHVAILDTKEVNAVSAPGGFIFVSRGMLKRVPNEDVLAAVLGHEVTHVAHHHGLLSLSREGLLAELKDAGVPLGLSCHEVFIQGTVLFGAIADHIAKNLIEKGYSRALEFDADAGSIKILQAAGFNPDGLEQVLKSLQKVDVQNAGGWFSTHPAPADRIKEATAILAAADADDLFQTGIGARTHRFRVSMGDAAAEPETAPAY